MPIYAYKCASCGHAKDVLQRMSDATLTTCPACGAEAFQKQVTAAGFQLKGSGWYVTDFRGGNAKSDASPASSGGGTEASSAPAATPSSAAAPAASTPAPAPAPASKPAAASSDSSAP